MQTINQLTANLTTLTSSEQKSQLSTVQASSQEILEPSVQLLEMMTNMFEDWKRVFGSKLKDRQSVDLRTAELWSIALQQLKITPKEFKTAMQKSITLEWPPTAPADFLELARGASEYPNVRDSYEDAAKGSYSHGVCLETARRVGFNALRMQDEKYTFPLWQKHYKDVCTAHTQGEAFELPQLLQIESEQPQAKDVSVLTNDDIELMRAILAGEK